jgi:hypothetical protein
MGGTMMQTPLRTLDQSSVRAFRDRPALDESFENGNHAGVLFLRTLTKKLVSEQLISGEAADIQANVGGIPE